MAKTLSSLWAYIESMRLYAAGIAVLAAWCGIDYYNPAPGKLGLKIAVLSLVFIGWGLNQVINDYFGQDADKINAPQRAIAGRRLRPKTAMSISLALGCTGAAASFLLRPAAAVIYALVLGVNLIYEKTKKIPLGGNFTFALMIVLSLYYGAVCFYRGDIAAILFNRKILAAAILIGAINFVFALMTDFKDIAGDKKTKTLSLAVLLGKNTAAGCGSVLITLPFLVFFTFIRYEILAWGGILPKAYLVLSFAFFVWVLEQIFSGSHLRKTHIFLATNISAVMLFEAAVILCV